MAKVTKSPLIGVISGSVNGMTFRKGKDGTQVAYGKITKISNPASANQAAQRSVLAELSKDWFQTLDLAKRAVFESFAAAKYGARKQTGEGARAIIHGNTGRGGGKGLYIYLNQNILSLGGTKITAPAPAGVLPAAPSGLVLAVDPMTFAQTLTIDAIAGSDTYFRIWIVGTGAIVHRQVLGTVATVAGMPGAPVVFGITTVNGAKGTPVLTSKLMGIGFYIQVETVDKVTGLASNPSETIQGAFGTP